MATPSLQTVSLLLNWKGVYNGASSYMPDDAVLFTPTGGIMGAYVAVQSVPPSTDPTNLAYWLYIGPPSAAFIPVDTLFVSVLDHGAKGDGTTDDTTAFNTAAALCTNGRILFVPGGRTYAIAGTVTTGTGVSVWGGGNKGGGSATGATLKLTAAGATVDASGTGGEWRGITIDGNAVATLPFKRTTGSQRRFSCIDVVGSAQDGAQILAAQNDSYELCLFSGAARDNLVLDQGTGGHNFRKCEVYGAGRYNLRADSAIAGGPYTSCSDITFDSTILEHITSVSTSGIYINANGPIRFKNSTNSAIGTPLGPYMDIVKSGARVSWHDGLLVVGGAGAGSIGVRLAAGAQLVVSGRPVVQGSETLFDVTDTGKVILDSTDFQYNTAPTFAAFHGTASLDTSIRSYYFGHPTIGQHPNATDTDHESTSDGVNWWHRVRADGRHEWHTTPGTGASDVDLEPAAAGVLGTSGQFQVGADPTAALQVATKQYVDTFAIQGAFYKQAADAATTGALPSNTATAATLTASANGAIPAQDGYSPVLNDALLVKNEVVAANDGIYTVTQLGDASHPWVLTRRPDADSGGDLNGGATVFVKNGATLGGSTWVQTVRTLTIGTTAQAWAEVSAPYGAVIPESQVTGLVADLAATEKTANKGAASGYCGLDASSLVPVANTPPKSFLTQYAPGTTATKTTTLSTEAAVDTTNLRVAAVVAPASGNLAVQVVLGKVSTGTGGAYVTIWANGSRASGTPRIFIPASSTLQNVPLLLKITGLTPGTSYNIDLAWRSVTAGQTTSLVVDDGVTGSNVAGPTTMQVGLL